MCYRIRMTRRRVAYFDCFAGVSGDMILGAFLDLGLPLDKLNESLQVLGLKGITVRAHPVQRKGVVGTQIEIRVQQKHRIGRYRQMRELISKSALARDIKTLSLKILQRLASVEARIHGVTVEQVEFHEIGDVDTMIDAVGASLGLAHFSWDMIVASPLPIGRGWVQSAHGPLPLPAPATIALLRGVPIIPAQTDEETVTPTGAVILTSLARAFGPLPAMEVNDVGYGAGARDSGHGPNLLRIITGLMRQEKETGVWVLEADVDDMNPELFPYLNQRILEKGALDVCQVPIQMKKGRPGFTIRVLAPDELREKLAACLMAESTTLGVRMHPVERVTLPREQREVVTRYGRIMVKVAFDQARKIVNLMPEYESCRQAAEREGIPLKEVYQEAITQGRKRIRAKE